MICSDPRQGGKGFVCAEVHQGPRGGVAHLHHGGLVIRNTSEQRHMARGAEKAKRSAPGLAEARRRVVVLLIEEPAAVAVVGLRLRLRQQARQRRHGVGGAQEGDALGRVHPHPAALVLQQSQQAREVLPLPAEGRKPRTDLLGTGHPDRGTPVWFGHTPGLAQGGKGHFASLLP